MNDTTTAATTWRDTEPVEGAIGRLVLKSDSSVTVPIKVLNAFQNDPPRVACFVEGASDWHMWFALQDWKFQVEQPPLPTAWGSIIELDGHRLVRCHCRATSTPWHDTNPEERQTFYSEKQVVGAKVLFDAGPVES